MDEGLRPMCSLYEFEIIVSSHMAGFKNAIKSGKRIIVSPAMHALMKDASPEELGHLLENLPVIDIGEPLLDFTIKPFFFGGPF